MQRNNINQVIPRNRLLMGAVTILVIMGLFVSGCAGMAIPTSAPAGDNAAQQSGGDSSRAPSSNESARDVSPTASPRPLSATGGGADTSAAPAAEEAADSSSATGGRGTSSREESYSSVSSDSESMSAGRAEPPSRVDRYEPVTAGVVDDNEEWADYLEYRSRRSYRTKVNDRDVSERYWVVVQDTEGLPVHDAEVTVYVDDDEIFVGRTDTGGRLLFHPLALDTMSRWGRSRTREFQVTAQKEWVAERQTFSRYVDEVWMLTLADPPAPEVAQVDLLFLMDATGSMDDEIAKLKASMADIADQIYDLPNEPDVRFGLVHYRDRGDAYVVQTHDFTHDLPEFQETLADLRAGGGGDYPESVNEALHRSLNDLNWRTQERDGDTLRLIFLVADAPPHLDYSWQDYSYDTDMIAAVGQGIKVFPIGASGLEEQGEYIFRQMAQFTGGKFVFLTYDEGDDSSSGPGTETNHDVENYSVNTLDKLVVRLVKDELASLTAPVEVPALAVARSPYPAPAVSPPKVTPTPRPRIQPVSCTLDLDSGWNDCGGIDAVDYIDMYRASRRAANGQALMKLTLDPRRTGYSRATFDVTYTEAPVGWTVNIGDSPSNNGYGGDNGDQSNDAEMTLVDGAVVVYGNDYTPARAATDGHRELFYQEDMIRSGENLVIEVANEFLSFDSPGGNEDITSPYLYSLARQPDREGRTNYELYAAFNRTIASSGRNGSGTSQVVITFYPR